ncbi:MAG: GNAT family N-acetyltransferase [Lachnospiraceae bacterium]|nr:GNAT family N-acetyltransferase [Lachnospiraceae bacterium]
MKSCFIFKLKDDFALNIVYKEFISVEDYNLLREAVGWEKICGEQAQQGLDNSAYVIGCYEDNKIVGSARIIWDRGYIAYLADVMVLPEYQGKGIGRRMVEKSIAFVKAQLKAGWKIKIVMVSDKGKEEYFK